MRASSPFSNLFMLRNQLGITQAHLAAASGVSEKTIKRAESGVPISSETRMAISAAIEDFRLKKSPSNAPSSSSYVGPIISMRRKVRHMVGWAYLHLMLISAIALIAGFALDQSKTAAPINLAMTGFVITMIVMGVARLPFGTMTSAGSFMIFGPLFLLAIDPSQGLATAFAQNWIICLEVPIFLAYAVFFFWAATQGTICFVRNQLGQGLRFGSMRRRSVLRSKDCGTFALQNRCSSY
jgi:transcriptional regulator with XRE-family HTH domain